MPSPADDFLTIGRIRKAHGRRGEVAAEILTDFPDRFGAGAELLLSSGPSTETRSLEASRFHKGCVILKFAGCDSIAAAETLGLDGGSSFRGRRATRCRRAWSTWPISSAARCGKWTRRSGP